VHAEIERCLTIEGFIGGKDGDGIDYNEKYAVYGMKVPANNPKYMSTSLFFCAVNDTNRASLNRWSECCNVAEFNGQGPYPGHGDQGVLNAVLFADDGGNRIELLDNHLWSQHWVYWNSIIDFRDNNFINKSFQNRKQRSFHCGGAEKFWSVDHRNKVLGGQASQTYPYVWFLTMLWFGPCKNWKVDPHQYLPPPSHHLVQDLIDFLPQIFQIYPQAKAQWDDISDVLIDRCVNGVHRSLSLGGGSMTDVINLVGANHQIRRYVEVGGYDGGSIITLGLRFANRDISFFSIESFTGNLDGTMDGHRLPSRASFVGHLARFPSLRVNLVPGDSAYAASLFDNNSLDCVFIDACHDTLAVLNDISVWIRKIVPGGIICGDDYNWSSVRLAVQQRFPNVIISPCGVVWSTRV
jgi:hypothetical protein